MAPELGDASAATGAVELTYDWDLPHARETLLVASGDPLAEQAPHWPPILDLAQGKNEDGAIAFEKWARLDPGSGFKAGVTCEFWYQARQFELAIRWGLRALERDPSDFRAGLLLAASYIDAGNCDQGLHIAYRMHDLAPDVAETNLVLVAFLAKAGKRSDARAAFRGWEHRKDDRYEWPLLRAIAYSWLGETSLALNAMRETIKGRHTVCLFARGAPYLDPLHGLPEFERMLNEAGLPPDGP